MKRRTTAGRRDGMTLLEVLVALAIFLLSIGAIASLVDFGSDRSVSAAFQSLATRLAQSKMAEVEAGVISVSGGDSGTFDSEPSWNYTVTSAPAGPPNLYTVTVTVSRDVGGKHHEVVLTQMMIDPTLMGNAAAATAPTVTTTATGGN